MRGSRSILFLLLATLAVGGLAVSQVIVTGRLSGTVTDQTGAVIPGAQVRVVNEETGTAFSLSTNEAGSYMLAAVPTGFYTVEVTSQGFRKGVLRKVKVDVGSPSVADVQLEVGAATESVEVQAESTAVVTATSTVGTTITGRQITELPFTSRDALDLALLMPGATSGGAPRASSFNALPKGSINITMDGVNTQDNLYKSGYAGGFFTYIRPRIDAIDEFAISTAVAGAESAAEGAVQIKFVTRRGTNDWHGGLFWYHRNTALNANYWFNNVNGLPRQRMILNQWGGKAGGPIIKNKLFIFGVFDQFRLPDSLLRTRTVLKSEAIEGIFPYRGTDGVQRTANLLQIAGANGFPSRVEPVTYDLLKKIDALRGAGGVGITPRDLFRDYMSFNNSSMGIRSYPTGRLDWNIRDNLQWEVIWNYQRFYGYPDLLNSADRRYPGFEKYGENSLEGGQPGNRFSVTTALRWMLNPRMNNEFRYGLVGGSTDWRPEINIRMWPNGIRPSWPLDLTHPLNVGVPSRRNTPVKQLSDNLGWQKGSHTLNFGLSWSLITGWNRGYSAIDSTLGVLAADPVAAVLSPTNLPGISSDDLGYARSLYALLTGRIQQITGSINVDEKEKKYVPFAPLINRERQTEFGFYFTDTWRVRSDLTLNYGLRWEFQGVPYDTNGIYTSPTYAGLWGRSGVGNLFAPGVMTGSPTAYGLRQGLAYNNDLNNFAPNFGFAWSPRSDNPVLSFLFGQGGAFRAGYGISYSREGLQHYREYTSNNPGTRASAFLYGDRDFPAGSLSLGSPLPPLKTFPESFSFPLAQSLFTYTSTGPRWFDPNLRVPYIQSWSAGIQREILKDTVLEVRYVGNHAVRLWRAFNLNEVNILENGFVKEFQAAQNNLRICEANRSVCTGALNFDNRGLPGQVNLPLFSAAFKGLSAASGFASGTFVAQLQQGTSGAMANALATSRTYFENLKNAGYPANFFLVNPDAAGATVIVLANGAQSTYNALQVEFRRRYAQGLLFNINYAWSHGLTNFFADSETSSSNFTTLRNVSYDKGASPYDIRHQVKGNWIYELPFGYGKTWKTSSGLVNRIIGGWEIHGIARIQSGRPFLLTSGRATLNQYESGVISNVSRSELQSMVKISKSPDKKVYFFDRRLIGPDGRANPQYLAPPAAPGQLGSRIFLFGPRFVRFDTSIVKRTHVNERWNVELRAEMLNTFNHANFMVGGAGTAANTHSITSTTFGQTNVGYQDVSTTNDPGGRIVQLVLRINF